MKTLRLTLILFIAAMGTAFAQQPQAQQQRPRTVSILEIYDVEAGTRTVVKEFQGTIEAPNWTVDGRWLIYNSGGRLYKIAPDGKSEPFVMDTGYATRCNNDHCLSFDGKYIAVSHGTAEDRQSRIYVLPIQGGTPRLVTPLGPSYLHGWSPDGRTLVYCASRNGEFDIYVVPSEAASRSA